MRDKKMTLNRKNKIQDFFRDLAVSINESADLLDYDSWEEFVEGEELTDATKMANFMIADDNCFELFGEEEILLAEINLSNNLNVTLPEDTLRLIINFHKDKSPHVITEGSRDITEDVINERGLIDVNKLENFITNKQTYWNIQIHKRDNSAPADFDEADARAEILFNKVEPGGALIWDASSDEYVIISADEVEKGLKALYLGTVDFRIVVQE